MSMSTAKFFFVGGQYHCETMEFDRTKLDSSYITFPDIAIQRRMAIDWGSDVPPEKMAVHKYRNTGSDAFILGEFRRVFVYVG